MLKLYWWLNIVQGTLALLIIVHGYIWYWISWLLIIEFPINKIIFEVTLKIENDYLN